MLHARSSNLRIDLGTYEDAFRHVSARGKRVVYLLSNPHNPTGVVHTREELTAVASLAREYGVRVVSDEIHAPLVLLGAGLRLRQLDVRCPPLRRLEAR